MNEHTLLRERIRELAARLPREAVTAEDVNTNRPRRNVSYQDQTGAPIIGIDFAWNTSTWGG